MMWQPKTLRNITITCYDVAASAASFIFALYLRWADAMWDHAAGYMVQGMTAFAGIMLVLILYRRFYRRLWRYVSMKDLMDLMRIVTIAIVVFYLAFFLITRLEMVPRSVPFMHWLLLIALLCAPRFLIRAVYERGLQLPAGEQIPVLLIGATQEAEIFIRESMRSAHFAYRVVGIVAMDAKQVGSDIHGARIYGHMGEIPTIVRKLARKDNNPQRLIITDSSMDGEQVRSLLAIADQHQLALGRMPKLTDLSRGDKGKFDIRPIDVEDILGRPQTRLDRNAMAGLIAEKTVFITGAGGSIGSELVRQIAVFAPEKLILFEQGEYNLYAMDRELQENYPDIPREVILGDVRDKDYVLQLMTHYQPDIVFHAAALKHVPLSEINIEEAMLTNIIGTMHVADACVEAKVPVMVQISTDKAVNPTNVMGACKRAGEAYAQALGQYQHHTRCITVRFGNVLGSTGSVVPLFQKQLERGGPLTLTHEEMTRYFMTIREAVQLVIQAAAIGQAGDDNAPIFVLDMGRPIKIKELAMQMIRLAGLRPEIDIAIEYTGLRAGEKLYEELFYKDEPLEDTAHPSIYKAQSRAVAWKTLRKQMVQIEKAAMKHQREASLSLLKELIPEYIPDNNRPETSKEAS